MFGNIELFRIPLLFINNNDTVCRNVQGISRKHSLATCECMCVCCGVLLTYIDYRLWPKSRRLVSVGKFAEVIGHSVSIEG